jgi:signal transduction histidine kinase
VRARDVLTAPLARVVKMPATAVLAQRRERQPLKFQGFQPKFNCMVSLDPRSITAVGTVTALLVSTLSALLWGKRPTYPGFGRWTLGNLCVSASLLFLFLRGVLPESLSVLGTNAAAFLAAILLLEGTREFLGLRYRWWPAYPLAGFCLLAQLYFLVVVDRMSARIMIVALCLGPLQLITGFTLIRGRSRGRRLGYWFTGVLFLANGFFNLSRGTLTWGQWLATDVLSPTMVNQLYFLGMVISVLGWAFGFIMLTDDRLGEDLREAERKTTLLNQELAVAMEHVSQTARKAAEADDAKTDFLAHMSHEIRTPLGGIIGLTELGLDGVLTEDKRPDLAAALVSARDLLGIVNDILDLSKIEAGQLSVTNAPFDLRGTLQEIIVLYESQAAAKGTILRLEYPPAAPLWFVGDQMRIRQIVSNFVSNAVKFTDVGEIELGMEHGQTGIRIWVRDSGIGISAGALPLLFTKFVQADSSTARRYGGTGLGLSISKQLAALMAGSVGATSSLGLGSTFCVELPLQSTPEPARPTVQGRPGSPSFAGLRVLVAEDNRVNRYLLVKLLEKQGSIVDIVFNGSEAVERVARFEYAVVLMDIQMPVMDGIEATAAIRQTENGAGKHVPIVAMTAHAMAGDKRRFLQAGMDAYVSKPINSIDLLAAIDSVLSVSHHG